jgi:hypothetical protein
MAERNGNKTECYEYNSYCSNLDFIYNKLSEGNFYNINDLKLNCEISDRDTEDGDGIPGCVFMAVRNVDESRTTIDNDTPIIFDYYLLVPKNPSGKYATNSKLIAFSEYISGKIDSEPPQSLWISVTDCISGEVEILSAYSIGLVDSAAYIECGGEFSKGKRDITIQDKPNTCNPDDPFCDPDDTIGRKCFDVEDYYIIPIYPSNIPIKGKLNNSQENENDPQLYVEGSLFPLMMTPITECNKIFNKTKLDDGRIISIKSEPCKSSNCSVIDDCIEFYEHSLPLLDINFYEPYIYFASIRSLVVNRMRKPAKSDFAMMFYAIRNRQACIYNHIRNLKDTEDPLFDAKIIFPIKDSQWGTTIQLTTLGSLLNDNDLDYSIKSKPIIVIGGVAALFCMLKLKDPSSDNFDAHSNFAVTEGLLEATKYALENIDQFCNTYNINIQDCAEDGDKEWITSPDEDEDDESFTICRKNERYWVEYDCNEGTDTCSCNNDSRNIGDTNPNYKKITENLLLQNKTKQFIFNFKLNADNDSFYNSKIELVKLVKCNSDESVNNVSLEQPIYYSPPSYGDGFGFASLTTFGGKVNIVMKNEDGQFVINETNLKESGYNVVKDNNKYYIYDSDDSYTSDNVVATFVDDGENSYVMDSLGKKYPPSTETPENPDFEKITEGSIVFYNPNAGTTSELCWCKMYLPDGSIRYYDCSEGECSRWYHPCYCYDNDFKYCSKPEKKLNCTYGKNYDSCFDEYKVEDGYYVYIKKDSLTIAETFIELT